MFTPVAIGWGSKYLVPDMHPQLLVKGEELPT
jgi:hypothetical protein